MTIFQLLGLSVVGLALARDCWRLARDVSMSRWRVVRALVLIGAGFGMLAPDAVAWAARSLGIGRGADLVIYLVALTGVGVSFFFYARFLELERKLTDVIRHLALSQAQRPGTSTAMAARVRQAPPFDAPPSGDKTLPD